MKLLTQANLEVFEVDGVSLFKLKLGNEIVLATTAEDALDHIGEFLDEEACPERGVQEQVSIGDPMSDEQIAEAIMEFLIADEGTADEAEAAFRAMSGLMDMIQNLHVRPH